MVYARSRPSSRMDLPPHPSIGYFPMVDLALGSVRLDVQINQGDLRSQVEAAFKSANVSNILAIATEFTKIKTEAKGVESAVTSMNSELGKTAAVLTELGSQGLMSVNRIKGAINGVGEAGKILSTVFQTIETEVKAIVDTPFVTLRSAVNAAAVGVKAFEKALDSLGSGADKELAKIAKAIDKIDVSLGKLSVDKAEKQFAEMFAKMESASETAAKSFPKIATAGAGAADKVAKAWMRTAVDFEKVTADMISEAKRAGAILVENLNHQAADTVAAAWRRTQGVFNGVMADMKSEAAQAGAAIVNKFEGPIDRLKAMLRQPIGNMSIGGFSVMQIGIDALRNAFQNLAQFAMQAFQQMGGALVAYTGKALKTAASISSSVNVVKSLTGQQDSSGLEQSIIVAGVASTQETAEIAKYTEQLARSGLDQKEIAASLKPIALLADASGEDIGKTGKAVIAAGNAYQLGSKDISKTATTLLAAATSAAGSSIAGYGKFQQYFKVQSESGQKGLETSAKIYALLKSGGAEDAAAGRNIASFYKSLATPSKVNVKAQNAINSQLSQTDSNARVGGFNADGSRQNELDSLLQTVAAYKALRKEKGDKTAADLFGRAMGVEAFRQIVALSNQSEEKINSTLANIKRKIETTDLVGAFYRQATSGLAGAQKLLDGAIDGFTAAYGLALAPMAGSITGVIASAMGTIASDENIFKPLKDLGKEFEAFTKNESVFNSVAAGLAEVGKALIGIGIQSFIDIFRDLQTEFGDLGDSTKTLSILLELPLRAFLLTIGGIKDLIILSSQLTKTFRSLFSGEMFGGGENPILKMFGPDVMTGFDSIKTAISTIWASIQDAFGILGPPLLSAFGSAFRIIGDIIGAAAPFLATFVRYLAAVTSVGIYEAAAALKLLASFLSPILNVIKSIGSTLAAIGQVAFVAFSAGIKNAFSGFFQTGNAIDQFLGSPIRSASNNWDKYVEGIARGLRGIAIKFGEIGGTIGSFLLGFGGGFNTVLTKITPILTKIGLMNQSIFGMGAAFAKMTSSLKIPSFGGVGAAIGPVDFGKMFEGMKSDGSSAIAFVGNQFNSLKEIGSNAITSIGNTFNFVEDKVLEVSSYVSKMFTSSGLFADLQKIATGLSPIGDGIKFLLVEFGKFALFVGSGFISGLVAGFTKVVETIGGIGKAVAFVVIEVAKFVWPIASTTFVKMLENGINNLKVAAAVVFPAIKAFGLISFEGLKFVTIASLNAIRVAWSGAILILTVAIGGFKVAAGTVILGLRLAWNGLVSGIAVLGNLLRGDVSGAFNELKELAFKNLVLIGEAFGGLKSISSDVFSAIGNFAGTAWGAMVTNFNAAMDGMKTVLAIVGNYFREEFAALGQLWNTTIENLSLAWQAFTTGLGLIWQGFTAIFQAVLDGLWMAWATLLTGTANAWMVFQNGVVDGLNALANGFLNAVGSIGNAWNSMCAAMGEAFNSIIQAIQSGLNALPSIISNIGSLISGGIGGAASGLIGIFSGVRAAIDSWMGPINNAIGGLKSAGEAMASYSSQAANSVGNAFNSAAAAVTNPFSGLLGFASGGVLPGYSTVDDTLIMARSGEGIIVPEAVKMLGGAAGIERLNRNSEKGIAIQAFATGGVVGLPVATVGSGIINMNAESITQLQGVLKAINSVTQSFPALQSVILALGKSVTPQLLASLGTEIGKLGQSAKKTIADVVGSKLNSFGGGSAGLESVAKSLGSDTKGAGIASRLASAAKQAGLTSNQIAYVLATAQHESDQFRTMTEYASGGEYEGRSDLGNTQSGDGVRYKGRGLVQITGRVNYKTMGQKLGLDLLNRPELAEIEENAIKIAIQGMKDGSFTGRKLSDYSSTDFVGMRAIINGSDRASQIAGYADKYASAIGQIGSIGSGASAQLLSALQTVANSAKGSLSQIGAMTQGGIQAALDKIPPQYRSAIETVLSGASKTLPGQLAQWLNQVIPGVAEGLSGMIGGAEKIVATARQWIGKEFNPGVSAQCANFVRAIFKQAGMGLEETLSRSADGEDYGVQEAGSLLKTSIGQVIKDKSKIMAGDIVTWSKTYGDFGNDVTHVGIATGNGMMIDRSTSSAPVRERPIDTFGTFVAAIRPNGSIAQNITVNAQTLKDGLTNLGSKMAVMAGAGSPVQSENITSTLQAAIDKLKNSKGVLTQDASATARQTRLDIANKDLEALKTKDELALKEAIRLQEVAMEKAQSVLSRAKTAETRSAAQASIDNLKIKQPLDIEKLKTAQLKQETTKQAEIDRIKAQIDKATLSDSGNGNIKKLADLQKLQDAFKAGEITEVELTAQMKALGVSIAGVGGAATKTSKEAIELTPTMRSLMTILNEGLKTAIDLAKQFRDDGNPIARQLQRLDLSDTQRLNALPQVYQTLLLGKAIPGLGATASSGNNVGPKDLNITFTTRSIGNEQFVPLSQAINSVRQATQATQDSISSQYQNSYSDRLRSGFG